MTVMWSVLSVLFVLGIWGMQALLGYRGVTFAVWQWVAYTAWLLWTLAGVALVWTFVEEREPHAVRVGSLVFGAPSAVAAIVLALLWILP